MSSQIGFQDIAPADNLLVVEDNGKSLSCRVSQVYGRALLGAMALRLNKLRSKEIHVSFLSQDESLTSNEIRKAAQVAAPRDNIMFIDDSRKILSCRINAEYGAVLIEKLQRTPDEASQTRGVALPHVTVAPASDYDNDIDMLLESPQRTSPELHGPLGDSLGILSDQILSSANRQPYDRDWMTKYNINEDCLNGPPGRHKIDVLLRYGAIKAGDKLCITYHPDGAPALRYGEVGFRSSHPAIIMLTSRLR